MIERKFVTDEMKEYQIQEYIVNTLRNVGHSQTKLTKTPLGHRIIIYASRPGLIVGRKGENIQKLTAALAKKYKLENLQIEISEVPHPNLDPRIVAERIAGGIERFGIQKFKAIAHRTMNDAMNSGAAGIEIVLSGKVPSSRARSWRFYKGYLKKSGEIAEEKVAPAYANAHLKLGTVGVRVRIMPSDIQLPDDVKVKEAQ